MAAYEKYMAAVAAQFSRGIARFAQIGIVFLQSEGNAQLLSTATTIIESYRQVIFKVEK